MPAHSWTTPQQWDWLFSLRANAQEARAKGRYSTWLASIYHDWFLQWPERKVLFGEIKVLDPEQEKELGKAIAARRLQLATWFNNHKNKTRGMKASKIPTVPGNGRKRGAQVREAWCHDHYDAEKKLVVKNRLAARREELGRKLTRSETMTITRTSIDEFFEGEDDEVRKEIAKALGEEKAATVAAQAAPHDGEQRTPEQYQHAVDNAPRWIEHLLAPVSGALGWCLTVIAAGPVPEEEGEIRSFALHFGRNQSGHTFAQAHPLFRENCVRPIVHFAKGVYPEEERGKRALRTSPSPLGTSALEPTEVKSLKASNASLLASGASSISDLSSPAIGPSSPSRTSLSAPSDAAAPRATASVSSLPTTGGAASAWDPLAGLQGNTPALNVVTTGPFHTNGPSSTPDMPTAAPYTPFNDTQTLPQDVFGVQGNETFNFALSGAPFSFDELGLGASFPFPAGVDPLGPSGYAPGPDFLNGIGHELPFAMSAVLPDVADAPLIPATTTPTHGQMPLPGSLSVPSVPLAPGVTSVFVSTSGLTSAPSAPLPSIGAVPVTSTSLLSEQVPPTELPSVGGVERIQPAKTTRPTRNRRPPPRRDATPELKSANDADGIQRAAKRRKPAKN
ncbi:hypothetical protein VTO73DRAFT_10737 [Trametes versicolor]